MQDNQPATEKSIEVISRTGNRKFKVKSGAFLSYSDSLIRIGKEYTTLISTTSEGSSDDELELKDM